MAHITKGANAPVPTAALRVAVCRQDVPGVPVIDASALLLDAAGKVRGDADLVFYNQPAHPSGAVRHTGTTQGGGQLAEWLELDLERVEPAVQRVVIAGSCDGGVFGQVPGLSVQALLPDGSVVAHYAVTDASSETAFVLGEFYRRNGAWKFRAVGQGYASGLAGLATDFGIAVDEPAPEPKDAVPPQDAVPPPHHAVPPQDAVPPHHPAPPGEPAPYSFGPEFPPYQQRGRGNGVVAVNAPLPPGPVLVEAWHHGDGYFGLHTLDRRNKEDELLFNTTLRDFRGRVLVHSPQDRPLRLRVEADEDWTVVVQPLSVVRRLGAGPLQGYGPEVVAHTGSAADLDVDFAGDENGEGYIGLKSQEARQLSDPDAYDLLVNDTDRLRQTVPLPDGPLLLLLEADGAWQLTARPLPVFDGAAAQQAGEWTGRGDTTVTLVNPAPGRPALLDYSFGNGRSSFADPRVTLLDEYDDEEPFLDAARHGVRGRTVVFRSGEPQVRLRLENTGDWRLHLLPIDEAPPLGRAGEGRGSAVLRYDGPPSLLTLARTTTDTESLETRTLQADGQLRISADSVGRRRPATGPLWVAEAGYCYVLVFAASAETGWRLEPGDPASVPVLDGGVQGQGYGVVRHTGPEAEVMIRHEPRGMLDLFVLWELDERLEPVRRLSTASGLQRVPSGFLQIRTSGKWSITLHG
ncbi:TerD family protein [Streptomyces sp. KL116D]|uniref:TerD family protein n=1 Tax=Streptomyces sp. KL116D TaxID=3045152 RepID=UPI0035590D89